MQRNSAYFLFLAVLAMLVIGVVMLFSTSAFAHDAHGDVYFFIKRQSLWLGIGLVVLIAAALVDYHFWYHTWWLWFLLALGTLALCFVPHFGLRINGSRRWVGARVRSHFSHRKSPRSPQYFFWRGGSRVLKAGLAT